ncbi:hypothetical protein EfmJHP9_19360 [Enterococcus faecium]|nr:hypothetical protein EfmJHP9_19360 [Enterococcus faecium]
MLHACTKPCIYHANSIYMMEKCLYYYRINENSITKKPQPYYWEGPTKLEKGNCLARLDIMTKIKL